MRCHVPFIFTLYYLDLVNQQNAISLVSREDTLSQVNKAEETAITWPGC